LKISGKNSKKKIGYIKTFFGKEKRSAKSLKFVDITQINLRRFY